MTSFWILEVLLWDILLWIPVKSLLRFRCVSRALRDHIDSPLFVELHMQASKATHDLVLLGGFCKIALIDCSTAAFSNPLRIYHPFCARFSNTASASEPLTICDYGIDDDGLNMSSCVLPRHIDDCFTRFCSCNGLICFLDADEIAWLWNPSTGKYRSIPQGKYRTRDFREDADFRDYVFGFGHDVRCNDYLIVRIFGPKRRTDPSSKVEIYSLNENCWTTLADIPYCIDIPCPLLRENKCPTLLNGVLHWVGRSLSSHDRPRTIVGFDIASRNFRGIPLPGSLEYNSPGINISVLDGCLCIIYYGFTVRTIQVMKEYGERESWEVLSSTKELTHVLSFSKKGHVIAAGTTGLCLYDVKNQSSRDLKITNFEYKPYWSGGVSFVESLVPL